MFEINPTTSYLRPRIEEVLFVPTGAFLKDSGEGGGGNTGTEPIIDDGTSHPWH
ncbi:MAG: hypothetical protein IJ654_04820 [Bacteroidales bacterium]|nr:hypothetical protein [Bacteroidales bacterium]